MTEEEFHVLNKPEIEEIPEFVSIHRQDRPTLNLRVFSHPNTTSFKCPICHLSVDGPVVLVPKLGTEQCGTVEAEQVHKGCFDMFGLMYMNEMRSLND